jgi:hypothetical protein
LQRKIYLVVRLAAYQDFYVAVLTVKFDELSLTVCGLLFVRGFFACGLLRRTPFALLIFAHDYLLRFVGVKQARLALNFSSL